MNTGKTLYLALLCSATLCVTHPLQAAEKVKTYQVTGLVFEITPTWITIISGEQIWQIARTKDTDISGEIKVGAKVTVAYRMVAASIQVKAPPKTK
jgi:hypothetical protein